MASKDLFQASLNLVPNPRSAPQTGALDGDEAAVVFLIASQGAARSGSGSGAYLSWILGRIIRYDKVL